MKTAKEIDKLFENYVNLLNACSAWANPSVPLWLMEDVLLARKAWRDAVKESEEVTP